MFHFVRCDKCRVYLNQTLKFEVKTIFYPPWIVPSHLVQKFCLDLVENKPANYIMKHTANSESSANVQTH